MVHKSLVLLFKNIQKFIGLTGINTALTGPLFQNQYFLEKNQWQVSTTIARKTPPQASFKENYKTNLSLKKVVFKKQKEWESYVYYQIKHQFELEFNKINVNNLYKCVINVKEKKLIQILLETFRLKLHF